MERHDCETGNATVNAMLRDGTVRIAVDTSYAESETRLPPVKAREVARHLRRIDNVFLRLTAPAETADAIDHEAKRVEVDADG